MYTNIDNGNGFSYLIKNIADLKNRTMVESNTLKSLILQSQKNGADNVASRDDILIHDYQIASSITMNSIL